MSKYADIDAAIIDTLIGSPSSFGQLYRGRVLRACKEQSSSADTVLHSRICALKKQGRIEFKNKKWHIVQGGKND